MKLSELQDKFENPPNSYRMMPLLRLNDDVDSDQMRWQIRSLVKNGFGGVFVICERFDNDLADKFLSDYWWDIVDCIAAICAEEGIEFWVYDDEDWPSGSVGGQLLETYPEFNWKYLHEEEYGFSQPGEVNIEKGKGDFVAALAYREHNGRIQADTLRELPLSDSDGPLSWRVPAGGWKVAVYTARPGKGLFLDTYGDLMDREMVAAFIDWVYKGHSDRVKKIPGAKLVGFFTDEPALSLSMIKWGERFDWYPSLPYTPTLFETFFDRHGYEIKPLLPLLKEEDNPRSIQLRCHYWETSCHLYSENYFAQIYRYCNDNGMLFSGHLVVEENFYNHLAQQGGNLPTHFRHLHIPGIDWIHPFEHFEHLPSTTPKYATSMAHLQERERTWCESFAASGWGLTFQEMRHSDPRVTPFG